MIASSLASLASSGNISGSGLAIAKIMGSLAIVLTISLVKAPLTETPMNTSASLTASASVLLSVSTAKLSFYGFMPSVLPLYITPLVSTIRQFSFLAPYV